MACFYLLGGLIIVIMNIENVPYMFSAIIRGAFTPQAVCGGAFGVAMKEAVKKGVARGLFSNEAGMVPHQTLTLRRLLTIRASRAR